MPDITMSPAYLSAPETLVLHERAAVRGVLGNGDCASAVCTVSVSAAVVNKHLIQAAEQAAHPTSGPRRRYYPSPYVFARVRRFAGPLRLA